MRAADYSGTVELQRISGFEDRLLVLHADPRVKISGDLIREAETAPTRLHGPPYAQIEGDLFRINADNCTVVYRLLCHITDEDVYLAEWPD